MRKNKGITLIALIITIIVMLILVAVSIRIIINSNLLGSARNAADATKIAYDKERKIEREIKIGEESLADYLAKVIAGEEAMLEWDGEVATGFANGEYNDENKGKGIGQSAENPWRIENGSQLAYFAATVNAGNSFEGEYVKIVNSIDLKNIPFTPISVGFKTEDSYWDGADATRISEGIFEGTLNGNNKWITNINIDMGEEYWSGIGFIGMMGENATIENVNIGEGTIKGDETVGRNSRIFFRRRDKKLCEQCKNYCT